MNIVFIAAPRWPSAVDTKPPLEYSKVVCESPLSMQFDRKALCVFQLILLVLFLFCFAFHFSHFQQYSDGDVHDRIPPDVSRESIASQCGWFPVYLQQFRRTPVCTRYANLGSDFTELIRGVLIARPQFEEVEQVNFAVILKYWQEIISTTYRKGSGCKLHLKPFNKSMKLKERPGTQTIVLFVFINFLFTSVLWLSCYEMWKQHVCCNDVQYYTLHFYITDFYP